MIVAYVRPKNKEEAFVVSMVGNRRVKWLSSLVRSKNKNLCFGMCSMGLGHLTLIIIEVGSRRRISGDDNGHNLCRERMWHPSRRMGMNLSFSSLSVLLVISSTRSMVNVDGWGGDGLEVIPNTVALIGVLRGLRRPLRLLGCGPPPP